MILLDLFCGRWGWSRAFAKRGWKCYGFDLIEPPETPEGCHFIRADILKMRIVAKEVGYRWHCDPFLDTAEQFIRPDAIVASSPCEEFSVHGMKHFHPNPKYPANGIRLFEHTRALCEASGLPYVIENVRAAQQFVGDAVHHCGPFYVWGNAVPPLVNQGISKKQHFRALPGNVMEKIRRRGGDIKTGRNEYQHGQKRRLLREGPGEYTSTWSHSKARAEAVALSATIPPELANTVAEYFERILEIGFGARPAARKGQNALPRAGVFPA